MEFHRYYAPSYSEGKNRIVPYRIDRTQNVEGLNEPAVKDSSFNPSEYSRKVLKMYDGNIPEQEVVMEADNKYVLNVIDRFGDDIKTEQIDDKRFWAKVKNFEFQ